MKKIITGSQKINDKNVKIELKHNALVEQVRTFN